MSASEQRLYARFPKRLTVDVHVVVMPETQAQEGFESRGKTIDIGRGGVLLRLDREVREGVNVRLRFWELPADVRLWPLMMSGTIVRFEPADDAPGNEPAATNMIAAGTCLAIEFTEPFTELEIPG